ncbi:MAG TPA: archease [Streptosporangiaceae bacterium]|nr:archease [Streptosporangiaceae bacterium]
MPHPADLRIEAWAATREECVAEAVRALVGSFADTGAQRRHRVAERHVAGDSEPDLVAAAIEEVIYRLDAYGEIPVAVAARRAADGGIDLTLHLAGLDQVEITGAVPKAVCLSGLRCGRDESGRWSCAVTIDV